MEKKDNGQIEIDILFLLRKIWSRKFLILLVASLLATIMLVVNIFLIKPTYTSTTRIYVVNQNADASITTQDLQAGDYLVKDYKEIITSSNVMSTVIENEGLDYSIDTLSKKITLDIPANTRIISISASDQDPLEASQLANTVREIAAQKIKDVTKVEDVTVLEVAKPSNTPSSPQIRRNTMMAFLAGGFLTTMIVLAVELFDDRVKRPEDIEEVLGMTLLGVIPSVDKLK
ncbi:Wzz/FepE/Etk N-terminal domain-containing protein [Streptococcus sp. CSL10205-OR2]|uniref:Wzz/FepE/Etk N-terminal domain-containing protein n=1 Tax=Streptococcus sp. CSL10205-OR2 TaxID=2980558 RepID=UPI0021D8EA80|nr:Wzz/FepE/Etk N-terminal domain-containing protein [Streptococcus sp. CSL10205-OR2]MCU9533602.1 Wzz/FepE/Etk N-terminal domain-containing protein [Streptococcus sp. CSL10205-OR2]